MLYTKVQRTHHVNSSLPYGQISVQERSLPQQHSHARPGPQAACRFNVNRQPECKALV